MWSRRPSVQPGFSSTTAKGTGLWQRRSSRTPYSAFVPAMRPKFCSRVSRRVFKAKVRLVIDAIAGGQLQSTGTLVSVRETVPGDRALAVLDIVDDMSGYQVPLGSAGEAAIYITTCHCCGKSFRACAAGRIMPSSKRDRMLRPESRISATAPIGNGSGLLNNLEIAPTRQTREYDAPLPRTNGWGTRSDRPKST